MGYETEIIDLKNIEKMESNYYSNEIFSVVIQRQNSGEKRSCKPAKYTVWKFDLCTSQIAPTNGSTIS